MTMENYEVESNLIAYYGNFALIEYELKSEII